MTAVYSAVPASDSLPPGTSAPDLGLAPPTRPEDLTPGLLLFFSRPSHLQSWVERWGQIWRHVGITVQTPNGIRVASYSAKQCYRIDDLEELMPNYDRIGVASVGATPAETQAISEWCSSFEGLERKEAPYTKSAFAVGPLIATARRKTGALRALLFAIVMFYCWVEDRMGRRRPSFVCSTFVWQALVDCTNCNVRLPMTAHPDDQAAYATPATRTDEMLARWLCGPGDLWQGISASYRSELELDHLTAPAEPVDDVIIDLRTNSNSESTPRGEIRSVAGRCHAALIVSTALFAERLFRTA